MKIFRDAKKFQAWCRSLSRNGRRIALVPTMGYLHEGHISLVETAKRKGADDVVVSIFVNPVQFGPNEDFEKYPRDEKADLKKCRDAGVSAVFLPTPGMMYLDGHSVYIDEERLSKGLCGGRRPGHFRGVCTVVAKLFNLVHPHTAVFGQKDFQQATIIRRMVRDLDFDVDVVVAPIVREPSGLALSSRNAYLSEEERENALAISRSLASVKTGQWAVQRRRIERNLEAHGLKVDYAEAVDVETLRPVKTVRKGVAVLIAAYDGKTRLIDNRVFS